MNRNTIYKCFSSSSTFLLAGSWRHHQRTKSSVIQRWYRTRGICRHFECWNNTIHCQRHKSCNFAAECQNYQKQTHNLKVINFALLNEKLKITAKLVKEFKLLTSTIASWASILCKLYVPYRRVSTIHFFLQHCQKPAPVHIIIYPQINK